MAMNIIKNAVCPGCTLLCDDVTFQIDGQSIQSDIKCDLAQQWIGWANAEIDAPRKSAEEVQAAIGVIASGLKQSKFWHHDRTPPPRKPLRTSTSGKNIRIAGGSRQSWRSIDLLVL